MSEYVSARENILKEIQKEMLGPGSDIYPGDPEEEIITDNPIKRYTIGILYPQQGIRNDAAEAEEESSLEGKAEVESKEDSSENNIQLSNQFFPSSMGITFLVARKCPNLDIDFSFGMYTKLGEDECFGMGAFLSDELIKSEAFGEYFKGEKDKLIARVDLSSPEDFAEVKDLSTDQPYRDFLYGYRNLLQSGWKRIPTKLQIKTGVLEPGNKHLEKTKDVAIILTVKELPTKPEEYSVTVTLVNNNKVKDGEKFIPSAFENVTRTIFQPEIRLSSAFFKQIPEPVNQTETEEVLISLLYRNKRGFAVGHGCSSDWDNTVETPRVLSTTFIPTAEVPQMEFDIKEIPIELAAKALSMFSLSDLSGIVDKELINHLRRFVQTYSDWIANQESLIPGLPQRFQEIARSNISGCGFARDRMMEGIDILAKDPLAMRSFRLANKAMLLQRIHSELCLKGIRYPNEGTLVLPDMPTAPDEKAKWRPFQLAFQLMNLKSLFDPGSSERMIVDLIWFPTGGGKTEAYLGLTAILIFFRRLKYGKEGTGTSVLMRYTLRLLTAQQFQRASTLICACEIIRKENEKDLGTEPVDIGLWVGGESTPNTLKEAEEQLDALQRNMYGGKNPSPVLSCPWCGTSLVKTQTKENGAVRSRGAWGYELVKKGRDKAFKVFCPESKCPFHKLLPIKVIDEDLYRKPPTLLFSTVDKYAILGWKGESTSFFARNPGNNCRSPELIIQDELHLISGPLGSLTGLFETAVDCLCSSKGVNPKIIASTATIRRAGDQVKNLYNRNVIQFPPPGLVSDDSFFTREVPLSKARGRLYVGLMSSGNTQTTTEVRLISALTHSSQICSDNPSVIDKFWTLVLYFNSLRELGKCFTLISDDVKDYLKRMESRKRIKVRLHYDPTELTSRKPPEDIPKILERLKISYPERGAISVLLASNMISVGVDVERLSLMTVVGQPKSTSEYIQATSRIGRRYPGLVTILYDGAKPRDRSHFENFLSYHQAFYAHVEPTSVTPFSGPARERALASVFNVLLRHLFGFEDNDSIQRFQAFPQVDRDRLMNLILERVRAIDGREEMDSRQQLELVINDIEGILSQNAKLIFVGHEKFSKGLLSPYGSDSPGTIPVLQSLRNVDPESHIVVRS